MSLGKKPDDQKKLSSIDEIEESLPKINTINIGSIVNELEEDSNLTLQDIERMEDIKDKKQDRDERKKYAFRTFLFLCIFTGFIPLIVIGNSLSQVIRFKLSDNVLIVLISTSFASVVSVFAFVMKYLFKK